MARKLLLMTAPKRPGCEEGDSTIDVHHARDATGILAGKLMMSLYGNNKIEDLLGDQLF